MKYEIRRAGKRIIFVPDAELKRKLKAQLRNFNVLGPTPVSAISIFRKKRGLRNLLKRHAKARDRFFVIIDFVHAFHQITRGMISDLFPKFKDSRFDFCFGELGGKLVIPIGFSTSSHLFEIFLSNSIDKELLAWQDEYRGTVTRYTDNILVTWRKNTKEALDALKRIFCSFEVRFTPLNPRKWEESIRFCGITIPRNGKPHLSNRKRKKMRQDASGKSLKSIDGVDKFIHQWS